MARYILIALIGMILFLSMLVGAAMEFYKKAIRKGRAGTVEIRLIALAISAVFAVAIHMGFDLSLIAGGLTHSAWLIVLYAALVFGLQLESCMKIWKPALKNHFIRKGYIKEER